MKMLTKADLNQLPKLYETEDEDNPIVWIKFFTPWSQWTWYVIEFDGEDVFYGYVDGLEPELGCFTLSELESVKGPFGLKVERDRYFKPCRLEDLKQT